MKISRRKFLQVTGLAAGASLLPLPVKYLGAGKAEAFYQSTGIPLYQTILRLSEIPVAIPHPSASEFAINEQTTVTSPLGTRSFPLGFPATGYAAQTGAPVTSVRHYTFNCIEYTDSGVLPAGFGTTTLWGYKPSLSLLEGLTALGAIPNTNNPLPNGLSNISVPSQPMTHLGGIILAESYRPIQLTMHNNLPVDHIIPNDLTIPGASLGANRLAVHFHGGLVPWISDGGPFDWFSSTVAGAPGFGTCGASFVNNVVLNTAAALSKTQGEYHWPMQQSARFGWFHDHAFGITRINAYAGIATGLVIRDNFERSLVANNGLPPLLEDSLLNLLGQGPVGTVWNQAPVREYPLVLQDKIFISNNTIRSSDPTWPRTNAQSPKGSLWYPHTYERARWARGPATLPLPTQSVIAEMFGDTILVNGTAFPVLNVQPRRYRFRFLNAQNARFANLQLYEAFTGTLTPAEIASGMILAGGIVLDNNPLSANFGTVVTSKCPVFTDGTAGAGFITQIGVETGFLPNPINVRIGVPFRMNSLTTSFRTNNQFSLLVGPAERPDVIIDFTGNNNKQIVLYGDNPSPFAYAAFGPTDPPAGDVRNDYFPGLKNGNVVNLKTNPANGPNSRIHMKFMVGNTVTAPLDSVPANPLNRLTPNMSPPLSARGFAGAPWNSETRPAVVNPDGTYSLSVSVAKTVKVGLFEVVDSYGRLEQRVGITNAPVPFDAGTPYEYPVLSTAEIHTNNTYEIWEVYNTTADVHPMHFHLINAQILNRQAYSAVGDGGTGTVRPPLDDEWGFKETIKCWPGELVRFIALFNVPPILQAQADVEGVPQPNLTVLCPTSPRDQAQPGSVYNTNEYVWHCHILEHEEHDMMRPLCVTFDEAVNVAPVPPPV
jgi:spore coat protein A